VYAEEGKMNMQALSTQLFGWIQWNQSFMEGALGGIVLGLGRMLVTFGQINQAKGETKYWQFTGINLIAISLFALIGGILTYATEGRAANIFSGIAALVLLSLLAGDLMPKEKEEPEDEG
jgi:hypothetical protein